MSQTPPPSFSPPGPSPTGPYTDWSLIRRVLLGAALSWWGAGSLLAQTPANDSFAGRLPLLGSTNSVSVSNQGATGEPGEPSHAGNPAGASLWWTWVAPDSGPVLMDTLGSQDFSGGPLDTVMAVYTGEAVNALTLVAADDDAPNLSTSSVTFPAVQGTAYQIAVDGYGAARGVVTLNLRLAVRPAPPAITNQPVGGIVVNHVGSDVTFAVAATGSFPLAFIWQKDAVSLSDSARRSYTVTNAQFADAGDYRVIVANAYGSVTSSVARLTVLAPALNDAFDQRLSLVGPTNSATGHNYTATREAGEPVPAGVASGASVWWSWTAPKNGLVLLDTAGSVNSTGDAFDTVLGVYAGSTLNSLVAVAANDDAIPGLIKTSQVAFRAVAGLTYQISVAGVSTSNGPPALGLIALNLVQARDNDFFANALVFPPGTNRVSDNNAGATVEAGEPQHAGASGGNSVWWSWVAPQDGTYALDTVGSSFDTVLAVYTGTAVDALTLVGEDDNRSDGGASLVKFVGVGGTTYQFAVDGSPSPTGAASGSIVLNLNAALASNDDFAERVALSGQTNRVTASNLSASKEPGEPAHGGNAGGRSLWWTWTAHVTGPVLVSTRGSTFDTALAVYTGTKLTALTLVAENDDTDPADPKAGSAVVFPGVAGQNYQIAVDGYRSGDGTVAAGTVTLALVQATPAVLGGNDLFVNRFPITGQAASVIGLNTNASQEAGEPSHDGNDGGRSLWWSWVAPATAPVQVDTVGGTFDTLLGVYQGTNVAALALVGADTRSAPNGKSIVTFDAVAGMEYEIAVDGFNDGTGAASGRVVLNLHQFQPGALHANDDFANATPIFAPFLTVIGNNIAATRQPGEPAHAGARTGHSVWWNWEAAADGPVTISTVGSQFDTLLAVYLGSAVDGLSLVAENDDINPGNEQSSVTFQAAAGMVYQVAVDGYGNEFGLITLTVSPGADVPAAPQLQQSPADQTRFAGGAGGGPDVSFQVGATGSLPLSYQWRHNGTNLPGATGPTLALTNVSPGVAGTYRVAVSNAVGSVLSAGAELAVLPVPFNDDFAGRILITGATNQVRGSILTAGKQPGEPDHGGDAGGRSVWWRWIAPSNGPVEVHTFGSTFDTLLGVYTGTAPGSLTLVGDNDDLLPDRAYASRVVFNAIAGQEYQIAVDGPKTNSPAGSVLLTLNQPPPPPLILEQPHGLDLDLGPGTVFTLGVTGSGLLPLFQYQWRFNGTAIPDATNASYSPGTFGRSSSGLYSVVITNSFGSVTSSNAAVWVKVPQQLQSPQLLPNGQVRLAFSDPDGTLSSEPGRFQLQHSFSLGGSATEWISNPGPISISNGRFQVEDPAGGQDNLRLYRVIEQ